MKNCVYRFLNSDNEIIYIGKAKDLKSRLSGHTHLPEECYKEKAKVEYATFSTMDEVDIAERYLISKIKPKYNTEFKSKEIVMTIDAFESLQWTDYNSKNNAIMNFKTRKELAKIDLDIQKTNIEIETIKDKMKVISIMKDEILEDNGKGKPCVVHINENTRYHVYDDDYESCNLDKVNRNSEGLDEYANLYERWFDEYDKKTNLLKKIDRLKSEKINLLLKANNKSCDEDMKALYKEYDSVDNEFILNSAIISIEDKYKRKLSGDIINYGYYDYNEFVQEIDSEFNYSKYINSNSWLRLIDDIESTETKTKCADDMIKNIESYLEHLFGSFKLDTIIKDGHSIFNHARVLPTAYLIKKPIDI